MNVIREYWQDIARLLGVELIEMTEMTDDVTLQREILCGTRHITDEHTVASISEEAKQKGSRCFASLSSARNGNKTRAFHEALCGFEDTRARFLCSEQERSK